MTKLFNMFSYLRPLFIPTDKIPTNDNILNLIITYTNEHFCFSSQSSSDLETVLIHQILSIFVLAIPTILTINNCFN